MKNQKTEGIYEKWIYLGLLILVVVVPLAFTPYLTLDVYDIAKLVALRVITLALTILWVLNILNSKDKKISYSFADFALIAFLILAAISTVLSINRLISVYGEYQRYEGLLTFLNYAMVYFLALQSFTSFERIKNLSRMLVLTSTLVSAYGLLQYLGLDPLSWPGQQFEMWRSFSTFGNPDLLAGLLVLALPAALSNFLSAKDLKENTLFGIGLVLISSCLLTTYTRGAWIAAAVGVIFFIVLAGKSLLAQPKKLLLVGIAFALIFAGLSIHSASSGGSINILERIKSAGDLTEGSAGSRLEIWKAAASAIKERPLFGFGPDTFQLVEEKRATLRYAQLTHGQSVENNAHNYFLQLATVLGLPAAIAFFAFAIGVIILSVKAHRRNEDKRIIYMGLSAASAGYLVYLLTGLSVVGTTSLFWITLGALVSGVPFLKRIKLKPARITQARLVSALALALILVATYLSLSMLAADYYFNRGLNLKDAGQPNLAIASFDTATRLYRNGLYYDWYGRYLQDLGLAQGNAAFLLQSKDIAEAATVFEPNESDHWVYLANAYAAMSKRPGDAEYNAAIDALKSTLAVRPNSALAHLLLADAYRAEGRYSEALRLLEYCIKVDPSSKDAHLLAGKVYQKLGNKSLALKYFKQYEVLNPDDNNVKQTIKSLESK